MDHYYTPPEGVGENAIVITGDDVHHISRVMRKSDGDEIFVSSGTGKMYRTVIARIDRDAVHCKVLESFEKYNELTRELILIQGVLKNPGKMDFIVEKSTELGVSRIAPVESRYTVAKGGKVNRWRSLALAAMKQCGRCVLPEVDEITSIVSAFDSIDGLRIVCYEQEELTASLETHLVQHLDSAGPIAIIIGPEGGFSDEELAFFQERGALFASLGSRRLRGETAAIAALSRAAAVLEQPLT